MIPQHNFYPLLIICTIISWIINNPINQEVRFNLFFIVLVGAVILWEKVFPYLSILHDELARKVGPFFELQSIIIDPFLEEMTFRNLFFGLATLENSWYFIIISAIIFAAFHAFNQIQYGVVPFVNYFVCGILYGWGYVTLNAVWGSFILHALSNALIIFGMYQMGFQLAKNRQIPERISLKSIHGGPLCEIPYPFENVVLMFQHPSFPLLDRDLPVVLGEQFWLVRRVVAFLLCSLPSPNQFHHPFLSSISNRKNHLQKGLHYEKKRF